MNNHLTDDIIWIQGARMPWFDTRLGHLKKENKEVEFEKLAERQAPLSKLELLGWFS